MMFFSRLLLLSLLLSSSALALPVDNSNEATGSVPLSLDLNTSPVKTVSLTLNFSDSDKLSNSEAFRVRVFNSIGGEVGSQVYTHNEASEITVCACINITTTADIAISPFTFRIEGVTGSVELDQVAVTASSARGPNQVRESVVPTLSDGTPPPVTNAITWTGPHQVGTTAPGNSDRYQGYFPDEAPWVPPNHTVPAHTNNGASFIPPVNNPGLYPVSYQLRKSYTAGEDLILSSYLHGSGPDDAYAESWFDQIVNQPNNYVLVANAGADYPSTASNALKGKDYYTYYGGLSSTPEDSTASTPARIAQSLTEVETRHADMIDSDAGVFMFGRSLGCGGSIHNSMIMPEPMRSRITGVIGWGCRTLIPEYSYPVDGSLPLAWGNNSPDTVNMKLVAPTGAIDHVYYRLQGGPAPAFDIMRIEVCEVFEDNKIAAVCMWHSAGHNGYDNDLAIPWDDVHPGDDNWQVRADKPLIVFTDATHNSPITADRGHYNLGLSWHTANIVESPTQLTVPLKYRQYTNISSNGAKPYPDFPASTTFAATVRRSDTFIMTNGQSIDWVFGGQSGTVVANVKGEVTIPGLTLNHSLTTYTPLVLSYAPLVGHTPLTYTRAPRPDTPYTVGGTTVSDGSNYAQASDVKWINSLFTESDAIYDDGQGGIEVMFNCTQTSLICAAQETRTSPDGTKIAYSVSYGNALQNAQYQGDSADPVKLMQYVTSAEIWIRDLVADTNTVIPNQPAGTIDRMPDWIDNDTIVFASTRGNTYPFKMPYAQHTGVDQFGRARWFSTGYGVAFEYPTLDPTGKSMQIWTMDIDGTNAKNLTPHEQNALRPTVLENGRIIFSSWNAHGLDIYASGKSTGGVTSPRNLYWISSIDPDGGDQTVLLNGHKSTTLHSTSLLPSHITGNTEGSDTLRALRGCGEGADNTIYCANYYGQNHRAHGIVYGFDPGNHHVEGCSKGSCAPAAETTSTVDGSGHYVPSSFFSFTPYGNAQDGPARRWDDPNTVEVEDKTVGKAAYPTLMPSGQMAISHVRGNCYLGSLPAEQNLTSNGGEPNCDTGIYLTKVPVVTDPFDTSQLEAIVDSPLYYEWDADAVVPYQQLYGQAMPTQHTAKTPGACYLQVVDATKAETAPPYVYDWSQTIGWQCSTQGCFLNSEDANFHANNLAGLAIHKPVMWDHLYGGGGSNADNFGGTLTTLGFKENILLGVQPLLADGSVKVRVPCETPIMMSGVDSDGAMIAHDYMVHSLPSGETRTCHGCHDGHSEERFAALGSVDAETAAIGTLANNTFPPLLAGTESLTFEDDVLPILESNCANSGCHENFTSSDPHLYSKIARDKHQWDLPVEFPLKLGNGTATGIQHVRIMNPGTGYTANQALVFPAGGAAGTIESVDGSGGITAIDMDNSGGGYATLTPVSVSGGGSGAVLEGMTNAYTLHKPYTSKWISKFARDSLFYWKCKGQRMDGRTDAQYPDDIDFGVAHASTATSAQCSIIARWIDAGLYHFQDPTP